MEMSDELNVPELVWTCLEENLFAPAGIPTPFRPAHSLITNDIKKIVEYKRGSNL
jgi:hypothetical protein